MRTDDLQPAIDQFVHHYELVERRFWRKDRTAPLSVEISQGVGGRWRWFLRRDSALVAAAAVEGFEHQKDCEEGIASIASDFVGRPIKLVKTGKGRRVL